jgi:hypothetical protein
MTAGEDDPVAGELQIAVKAVEELAPAVREFAESVGLFDPAREVVGGWTDRLKIRREVRRLEALTKAAEKVKALGVPVEVVQDRLLIEILEGAADEDDPSLAEAWSNLLVSAATGGSVAPSFPSVLRQLEPVEARFLDAALRAQVEQPPMRIGFDVDSLPEFAELEWRHLDNLERLGLLVYEVDLPVNIEPPERPRSVRISVNPFGKAFVAACTEPG